MNPPASFWRRHAHHSWTLALGAADLGGDGLPEIYFANDFGNDRLLHNRSTPGHPRFVPLSGERTLATPQSKVLGHDSFKGMGVDFADLNGDGLLDIYVSNIAQDYALEENHFAWVSTGHPERMRDGIAPYYVDRSEPLGLARSFWAWDARLVDFDNDGVPEAIQATGEGQISRGIAVGDVDGDGRLDYAVANQWGDSYFFHNLSPAPGAFLGLDLRLPVTTGRDGPGARLPAARQAAFGAAVAAVYGTLLASHVVFTPFFALTVVSLGRGAMLWAATWRRAALTERQPVAAPARQPTLARGARRAGG